MMEEGFYLCTCQWMSIKQYGRIDFALNKKSRNKSALLAQKNKLRKLVKAKFKFMYDSMIV